MTPPPDLWRGWVFLGGLGLFLAAETAAPARPWRDSRLKRLGFHAGLAAFNTLLLRLTAAGPLLAFAAWAREHRVGLLPQLALPAWAELLAALVLLDFLDYLWHRWNHAVPLFWRFHKVHHVDTHLDATTSLRFHAGEFLFSSAMKAGWIALVGPSLFSFAVFEAAITLAAQFHHANLRLPEPLDRALWPLIVTPRYHASHHTVTRRSREANYATIFSVWDKLCGSYEEPDEIEMRELGLPAGRDAYLSPKATLGAPFVKSY
jgi:sterol desaturase/sphingolipid hydroxylase (fatty acid hydroxylase superfamily)